MTDHTPTPTQPPAAVPEALRLADKLNSLCVAEFAWPTINEAAVRLRRYHARVAELEAEVEYLRASAPTATQAEQPGAALTLHALADLIEGMSVSVDVSTDEASAHHRYFGTVTEVMEDLYDKHGVTLLVQDAKPNFTPAAPLSAKPLTRGEIRDVFLRHGFTVKEGQTDLKEYVYDAAYALLELAAPAPTTEQAAPVWKKLPYKTPAELWKAFKAGATFVLHYHGKTYPVERMQAQRTVCYVEPPGFPVKVYPDGRNCESAGDAIWLEQLAAPGGEAPAHTHEQRVAVRNGHEVASSDAYFAARAPMLDTLDRRRVFTAGFERGWDAAQSQEGGAAC